MDRINQLMVHYSDACSWHAHHRPTQPHWAPFPAVLRRPLSKEASGMVSTWASGLASYANNNCARNLHHRLKLPVATWLSMVWPKDPKSKLALVRNLQTI